MAKVYLGLGSNIGDRESNLKRALDMLPARGVLIRKRSSLYETEPWGERNQPLFLNMVVESETALAPQALLGVLKDVEAALGREKARKWGPRIIDLDILLYNHIILSEDFLKIPHPCMHEREFVLRPLHEIAPDAMHPLLGMNMRELIAQLGRASTKKYGTS